MKLRNKLLLELLFITIIPILIIVLYSHSHYAHLLKQQINDIAGQTVEKAVQEANTSLSTVDYAALLLSQYTTGYSSVMDDLRHYSSEEESHTPYEIFQSYQKFRHTYQSYLATNEFINGIFLFTPSGEIFNCSNNIDVKNHYSPLSDTWYQRTLDLNGGVYSSEISVKDFLLNAKPSIFFSRAIFDIYTNEFLGVLLVDCSQSIFDLSSINPLPHSLLIAVEDTNTGNMLYSNVDFLKNFLNQSPSHTQKQSLLYDNLQLTSTVFYSTIENEFTLTKRRLAMIGILCVLMYIIASFLLSRNIAKPITYLSGRIADRNGHNQVTDPRCLTRTDEIGILCNEYNTMLDELNRSIKTNYQNKLITLDSQMRSLESQINSHFLYNTLEAINSIAVIEHMDQISVMSLALGNMLRYSIKTDSELVTVEEELNHVENYISIQSIRFGNRFSFHIQIEAALKRYRVLKLILQPVVENAFYHGLLRCTCGSRILLSAHLKDRCICFLITDDGKGMTADQLHALQEKLAEEPQITELGKRDKRSIGLKNIHSRIELYYGTGYGLSIESKEDHGTTVAICVPILDDLDLMEAT